MDRLCVRDLKRENLQTQHAINQQKEMDKIVKTNEETGIRNEETSLEKSGALTDDR